MAKTCLKCKKVFKKKVSHSLRNWAITKYCSRICYGESKKGKPSVLKGIARPEVCGENHPNWKGGFPNCLVCEKKLSVRNSKYCAYHKLPVPRTKEWRENIGKANIGKNKGKKWTPEQREKVMNWWKNSPKYKGGIRYLKEYRRFGCSKRRALLRKCAGDLTFEKWEEIKEKYNHTCLSCKRKEPEIILSVDHIVPLSRGGKNDCNNVQPLCMTCNKVKHIKVIDFRKLTANNS